MGFFLIQLLADDLETVVRKHFGTSIQAEEEDLLLQAPGDTGACQSGADPARFPVLGHEMASGQEP